MTAVAAGVIDHSRGWGDDQMTTVVAQPQSLLLCRWFYRNGSIMK